MPSADFDIYCANNRKLIDELATRFGDYQPLRDGSRHQLLAWLHQFRAQHRDLAIRLAQKIEYYSTHRVTEGVIALRKLIDKQIEVKNLAQGEVVYVAVGRGPESGGEVLRRYRNANQLYSRTDQFVEVLQLMETLFHFQNPGVFFLDDFIGTGKQVSNYWRDTLYQLVPDYIPLYLAVIAAYHDGIKRIENDTPLKVIAVHTLDSRHQLLGGANTAFDNSQKTALKKYCEDWGNAPLGYGEIGALISFAHGTPNNAPSIIRGCEKQTPQCGLLPSWKDLG